MGVALGYTLLGYDSLQRGLDKLRKRTALAADLDAGLGGAGRAHPDGDAPLRPARALRAAEGDDREQQGSPAAMPEAEKAVADAAGGGQSSACWRAAHPAGAHRNEIVPCWRGG